MFKIEKGVPVPKNLREHTKYPFSIMEIGDSFEAPISERVRLNSASRAYAKRHGKRFSGRKTPDGTVRIWRVA